MLSLVAAPLILAAVVPVVNQAAPTSFPAVGSDNVASVGDELLTQGTMTAVKGVVMSAPFGVATFSFTGGFYRETGEDEKYLRLQANEKEASIGYGTVLPKNVIGIDMAMSGVSFKVSKSEQRVCIGGNCKPALYSLSTRLEHSDNEFQQTLIYNGLTGSSVKIGYREFKDDMARAAFSNEIEYDLSKSKIIAYKRARLEIIEADNTHITYRVIANFN